MASINARPTPYRETTHGGVKAQRMTTTQALRRSVMSCLLWENEFYESGQTIADRILALAGEVPAEVLAQTAVEAREVAKLRHAPLLLLVALAKHGSGSRIVSTTIARVIQRADELTEFLTLYWALNPKRDGRNAPLSAQVKRGLALAMQKFDAYQLAKYDREREVRLRDVAFLAHAKPGHRYTGEIAAKLVNKSFFPAATKSSGFLVKEAYELDGTPGLGAPDTWEVALSTGGDKKDEFTRLLAGGKLGYLALLKNLRNMHEAGVDRSLVIEALRARKGADRVFPFRFIAAARAAPSFEAAIDEALVASIAEMPRLLGRTLVLVDVSGSMDEKLSGKSDLTRMDAAASLASILPADDQRVFSFSTRLVEVPARKGMAGVEAIIKSQAHGGTALAQAVAAANTIPHDRLIVITDEQATSGPYVGLGLRSAHDARRVPDPVAKRAYMINVASAKNGVGYGKWTHIDGFSENVLRYISEIESADLLGEL